MDTPKNSLMEVDENGAPKPGPINEAWRNPAAFEKKVANAIKKQARETTMILPKSGKTVPAIHVSYQFQTGKGRETETVSRMVTWSEVHENGSADNHEYRHLLPIGRLIPRPRTKDDILACVEEFEADDIGKAIYQTLANRTSSLKTKTASGESEDRQLAYLTHLTETKGASEALEFMTKVPKATRESAIKAWYAETHSSISTTMPDDAVPFFPRQDQVDEFVIEES